MFNVIEPQPLIEGFPLKITCLDHIQLKTFIVTEDGSIFDYTIEEEPFTITLSQVHKQVSKLISKFLILPKSRSLVFLLKDGGVSVCDYSADILSPIPLTGVKAASVISRSPFTSQNNTELLAVGVKRGISLFNLTISEVRESDRIPLPGTPTDILFIEEFKIIAATKLGVYLVDLVVKSAKLLYAVIEPNLLKRINKPSYFISYLQRNTIRIDKDSQIIKNDTFVYCTRETTFTQINVTTGSTRNIFMWSTPPTDIVIGEYYVIGLVDHLIEIRSLKTGVLLQKFVLESSSILNKGDLVYIGSFSNVWRLLPLDFDDQIDELMSANRFEDAEAFIHELEFASEEDKQSNIIKVKGIYAQHLFNVKHQYGSAIKVLESLNASPLDVLELYPEIMFEGGSENQSELLQTVSPITGDSNLSTSPTSSVIPNPSTENGTDPVEIKERLDGNHSNNVQPSKEKALAELSSYLSKERVKLTRYIRDLEATVVDSIGTPNRSSYEENVKNSLADCRNLKEVVETALLQVYLTTGSTLLGSLLRVENSCNYERTVELLMRFNKYEELIDFYRTKGHHQKALTFIRLKCLENKYEKIVEYIQRLDFNENVTTILEFAKYTLEENSQLGLKIFTENPYEVSLENRRRIAKFLTGISEIFGLQYLEFLVITGNETDVEINTQLCLRYLDMAKTNRKSDLHVQKFSEFINKSNYYDAETVLPCMPINDFLMEKTHVLSLLKRHEDSLIIFLEQLHDFNLAEQYCMKHYRQNDSLSNSLYTTLFRLYKDSNVMDNERMVRFLNDFAFRIDDGRLPLEYLAADYQLGELRNFLFLNSKLMLIYKNHHLISENLVKVSMMKARNTKLSEQKPSITISDDSMCQVCFKRLSSTIFTLYEGKVTHTYCASKQLHIIK
ncbi:vacuolar sorting protein 39 domain 1-domain-containing protein [Globomyces pollinis-pini]|nr:vacuolar sorting protein 39 domain 1-domain-containing protein [Globomyces pollinis-pini]